MRKYLYLILFLFAISLTGCGAKDVTYDTEVTTDSDSAKGQDMPEESSGGTLAQTLGIEEDMWKEEIGSGVVNAAVEIPEGTDMYTQEVTEHYYTPEEQKKIAEYFLDEDTIQVNKNKVISKEWVQKRIDYCAGYIDSVEQAEREYFEGTGRQHSPERLSSIQETFSDEIDRLMNLMNEVPNISGVSETIPDYSENYYIGRKGDVKYTLSFDMEEETNTSSWTLEAMNSNDFSSEQMPEGTASWHEPGFSSSDNENICDMTREEACAKAKELCEQFGITDMEVVVASDLMFYIQTGDTAPYEYNGYYIVLVRHINGVAVDSATYRYHRADEEIFDANSTERTYDREKVVVELNDKGIISMTYEGCMAAKEAGNAVKLLTYNQIQEIFRKELSGLEEKRVFKHLYLMYARVADETKTDQHCYIPVWCLSEAPLREVMDFGYDESGIFTETTPDEIICLNAMDGSRIDPDKAGFVYYSTPKDHTYGFEFNWGNN